MSSADFWQYAGVFIALVVSAFGAPIPEELPIATGGVLVGQGWGHEDGLKWWIMLPLCIGGVVLCDTLLYLIGRQWGSRLMQRQWVQRRLLPPAKRAKIEKNFDDYGIGILLVARLMPGIRTPVFITAGMSKLSFRKFLFADALYAIPGVNFFFWMAYWFTDSFTNILHKLEDYRHILVVAIVSFIAGFVAATFVQRRVSTGDPKEIPVVGKTVAQISHHLHESHKPPADPPSANTLTPAPVQPHMEPLDR